MGEGRAASRTMSDSQEREWNWRHGYSRSDATWVSRPDGEPWRWSEPIQAIVQDSHKLRHLRPSVWSEFLELCQGILDNLYDQGFSIFQVTEEDVEAEREADHDVHRRRFTNAARRLIVDEGYEAVDFEELFDEARELAENWDGVTNWKAHAESLQSELKAAKAAIHPGEAHAGTVIRLQAENEKMRKVIRDHISESVALIRDGDMS